MAAQLQIHGSILVLLKRFAESNLGKDAGMANPPTVNLSRVHDKLLIIDYYSKRRIASLAVGIIRGIALYYGEDIRIVPTSYPNDERVQIRIEFN